MKWLENIKSMLEQGSELDGEVGLFFSNITSYFLGVLIFITILYLLKYVPFIKVIHDYAKTESLVDREESEFVKMFTESKTRININIGILIGLIVLMLVCALIMFGVVSVPFFVIKNNPEMSVFSTSMVCLILVGLLSWSLWLLSRFKEQTARAIRVEREHNKKINKD